MIKFLDADRIYTNRDYLTQWYPGDVMVVTDNDLDNVTKCKELLLSVQHMIILDVTHNPLRHWPMDLAVGETLTNNIEYYYHPSRQVKFFPLFLWAYSLRNTLWWDTVIFDNQDCKDQSMMCLNNRTNHHRTYLHQCLQPVVDKIMYTIDGQGLPGEDLGVTDENPWGRLNDVGIGHEVYARYAVNIVTETVIDHAYISEKTCKPFLAYQIPIIVGGAGINRFLHNVGLDMFNDIIPWHTWDDEPKPDVRLHKIADFVIKWLTQGTVLEQYTKVQHRVQQNKHYFHSHQFRDKIMWQMQSI